MGLKEIYRDVTAFSGTALLNQYPLLMMMTIMVLALAKYGVINNFINKRHIQKMSDKKFIKREKFTDDKGYQVEKEYFPPSIEN